MASVKIAVILSVISLLLLLLPSHATRLPNLPDDTTAAAVAGEAPEEDADPTVLVAPVEKKEISTVSLPTLVQGFDHVDLSLRRPLHRHFHHRHCRHHHGRQQGHWFRGRQVVPYGNDMISLPKGRVLDGGLKKEEETGAAAEVVVAEGGENRVPEEMKHWDMMTEWQEAAEEDSRRKKKNKVHKRKKAREEDSDSDSDDEEVMEMEKEELKKKMKNKKKKEKKGGWLKWFWGLWY